MAEIFSQAHIWLNHLSSEAKFFRDELDQKITVVNKILDGLGRPDKSFDYRVIVGGTAGKGTTTRSIEQTLEAYGTKTALISSPHIQIINERVRIGGQIISAEDFAKNLLEVKSVSEKIKVLPTYYEAIVLAGILAAKKAGVVVLICEVGIGGEFDAVNAVQGPRIAAVTFIGDDHLEMFDNSLQKLASAKAGIFTADSVYNVSFEKKFRSLLVRIAGKSVEFVTGIKPKLTKKISKKICEKILGNPVMMKPVRLPCRWEKIDLNNEKQLILDGAHSGPRFEFIIPKIKKLTGKKTLILGMTKNHKPDKLEQVLPLFDQIIWTEIGSDRETWSAIDLQSKFQIGSIETDPVKALALARQESEKILVTGSLYLGGIIREGFYPSKKIIEQRTEWPM